MSDQDRSLANIEVISSVRNEVSLEAIKSTLVAVYAIQCIPVVSTYDVTCRLCRLLTPERIPYSALCDGAPVCV